MQSIKENLHAIKRQIADAAAKCERAPESVTLLAVSKTKPVSAVQEAIEAGQRAFGENYVQEGVDKIQHFATTPYATELEWHFIGPLQSNKSRLVAEHFDWMHTVDRLKIAQRLSEQRPADKAPLNVLIQVKVSSEESKSGIDASAVSALADQIAHLPNLRLRGLMTIPQESHDYATQYADFAKLTALFEQLKQSHPEIDTLSMGMTGDMSAAIAAGSTMVRIGTAIFGARDYGQH
ncbi:MAG: YggS family pyridoxal phosphate-dependent enzyme [Plesiomonas sp.]